MNLRISVFASVFAIASGYASETTFYIEPKGELGAPIMPPLQVHAPFLSQRPDAEFVLTSSAENHKRSGIDDVRLSTKDSGAKISSAQQWDINSQLQKKIFGGKVYIKSSIGDHATTFLIRGKNPSDEDVKNFIKANCKDHWYAWAIAQHESRQHFNLFNQFNTQEKIFGTPNYGAPDGWGIMQLDSSRGSEISTEEVYNWQANVLSGLKLMDKAKKEALAYFNAVKRTFPDKWEEPPTVYTPQGCVSKLAALDAAVIQMYNGAAVVRKLKTPFGTYTYYRSCWEFDENAAKGSRWRFKINNHDYVHKVVYNEIEGHIK